MLRSILLAVISGLGGQDEIRGFLGLAGGDNDRARVGLQGLHPVIDVRGAIFQGGIVDPGGCAEEPGAHLGDELFPAVLIRAEGGIGFEGFPGQAGNVAGGMGELVEQRGIILLDLAEKPLDGNGDGIGCRLIEGAAAAKADRWLVGHVLDDSFGLFDRLRFRGLHDLGKLLFGDAFDVLHAENGVIAKDGGIFSQAVFLLPVGLVFLLLQVAELPEDNGEALGAFLDMGADGPGLVEGEEKRAAGESEDEGIDSPVRLPGDEVLRGAPLPGPAPGDDAFFEHGKDSLGHDLINFRHFHSPFPACLFRDQVLKKRAITAGGRSTLEEARAATWAGVAVAGKSREMRYFSPGRPSLH